MARTKINMSLYTHVQLKAIMNMPIKKMSEDERRVYSKVKAENWMARKKGMKEPYIFNSSSKDELLVKPKEIISSDSENQDIEEEEEIQKITSWEGNSENLKVPKYINVPHNYEKTSLNNKQCFVNQEHKTKIGKIIINNEINVPEIHVGTQIFQVSWEQAWWAVNYMPCLRLGKQI